MDEVGNVYAVINGQHYIQVLDKNGTVIRSIGTKGSTESDFNNPCGIAIQGNMLYVTDLAIIACTRYPPQGSLS